MTDKEVIIDGVNVAGCCYIAEGNECEAYQTECEAQYCYYKQLQREKQKCEQYRITQKHYNQVIKKLSESVERYKQALEKIKKIISILPDNKSSLDWEAKAYHHFEAIKKINEVLKDK